MAPGRIQPALKRAYLTLSPGQLSPTGIRSELIETLFDSEVEYRSYVDELSRPPVSEYRSSMLERYRDHGGEPASNEEKPIPAGLDETAVENLYAVIRALRPDVIVETGVHLGHSTTYILAALARNDHGTLHSIDPAMDSSMPPGTDQPGWLVPETLRDRWNLHVGTSQRVLPELLPSVGSVDLFLHDSEHSTPCMLYEYELAWEWFGESGLLLSDDIHWNDAFGTFADHHEGTVGRLSLNTGYVRKTPTDSGRGV